MPLDALTRIFRRPAAQQLQADEAKRQEDEAKLLLHILETLGQIREQNNQVIFRLDGLERATKDTYFNNEKMAVELAKIRESASNMNDQVLDKFETFMNLSHDSRPEKPKKVDHKKLELTLPERSRELYRYLMGRKGKMCELEAIAREAGFAKNDASARLSDMVDRGLVVRRKAGRVALYGIP